MRLRRRAAQLTLLPEARPVSPPAWQDDGREVLTCDGSGLSFSASAARLVPAGSWQRTLAASLASNLTGLTGCAVSLRVRATKSGRSLLVPDMSALRTGGTGSGSLEDWVTPRGQVRQWPAPRAEDSESAGAHVARGTAETLTAAARLWPTATGEDSRASGSAGYSTESGRHPGTTLTDAANGLWASPQARDWKDSGPTQGTRGTPENPVGVNLGTQANRWATPTAQDCEQAGSPKRPALTAEARTAGLLDQGSSSTPGKRRGSRDGLNPDWVAQLLGLPDGWLSPPSALSDEWLFHATAGPRSKPSATPSSRSARQRSGKRSSTRRG